MRALGRAVAPALTIFLGFAGAEAAAQTAAAASKPEGDWTRTIGEMLPAIRVCLEQPAVPVESILKAWPMSRGLVSVRLRSTGGHRFDCIAAEDGSAVNRLMGLMPEEGAVPGEGDPVFLPKRERPPAMRVDALERITDASGAVQGWLFYPGRAAVQRAASAPIYGIWHLEALEGRMLTGGSPPMTIAPPGKLDGEGSCSRVTGAIDIDGAKVKISRVATTRRACAASALAQQRRYVGALRRAAAWRIEDERLILSDSKGAELLRLRRAVP